MKGLYAFGEYAFEFLILTVLVALSAVLVLPFSTVITGVTGYFKLGMGDRRLKDIFVTIGQNWKILIFYTLFQLIILVFPIFNIYFFNTHPENINNFVLAVSYITLIFGVIYLVTAPTVIVNMNVTFRQLLYNGFMLIFGGLLRSILSVACVAGVVAMILYFPYTVVLTFYAVPLLVSKLMGENMYVLKAKALKTSVYELKKAQKADDYLNENGEINRLDETENKNEKD